MVLLTVFYEDSDPSRRDEFLDCLRRNVENDSVAEVHLFLEEPHEREALVSSYPLLDDAKVRMVPHGRRSTYRDLFDYANAHLPGRRVAVANADLYFDESLARLAGSDLANRLLCLSRWDVYPDGSAYLFDFPDSQDAWIFEAPIRPFPCDFHLGLPGCDNRLAWEAAHVGLEVLNPARSLRSYHLHLSQVRRYTWDQRVYGPTLSVPAGYLGPAADVPCASVAFSESMGYAISTLEPGVSSHVNLQRPFTAIPGPLRRRPFTQVVASSVSPIEVDFLAPGKLFVLVGNDWWGYHVAREWLAELGYDERLPLVETSPGVGFETWSLLGDRGDRFVLPTQVMLVADTLVRNGAG